MYSYMKWAFPAEDARCYRSSTNTWRARMIVGVLGIVAIAGVHLINPNLYHPPSGELGGAIRQAQRDGSSMLGEVRAAKKKSGIDPCRSLRLGDEDGVPQRADPEGELVLVTGGSGFIGSHLVEQLLELGYTVRVFDNLETGNLLFLDLQHPRLEFHYGSIMDLDALRAAMGVQRVSFIWERLARFFRRSKTLAWVRSMSSGTRWVQVECCR